MGGTASRRSVGTCGRGRRALLLLSLSILGACAASGDNSRRARVPQARAGVLDLRRWHPDADGPAQLSGEWELYWGVLLPPSALDGPSPPTPTGLFDIPGRWDDRQLGGTTISTYGAGTYHLRVLLPPGAPPLGVRMRSLGTAYALFANGELVTVDGRVGRTQETSTPSRRPHVAALPRVNDTVDLVLQVSNFHYRKGGPVEPFTIGRLETQRSDRERAVGWGMFVAGAIIVIGLYNLGLYWLRREDRRPLFFAGSCLAIGSYATLVGERFLVVQFPGIAWATQIRLTNLTSFLALPLFVAFLHAVYPDELRRGVARALEAVGLTLVAAVLLTPASVYSELLPGFHALVLVTGVTAIVALVRAIGHRREGAALMLGGFGFFLATVLNDVLYDNVIVDTGQFIPLGLFVFILSQSMLLSMRSARAFRTVEDQGAALALANATVRRELAERQQAQAALVETEARLRQAQKMEAIGTLAGGVAHDFRNQLTVISGYADLLAADRGLAPHQTRRAEAIQQAAGRSTQLTAQLLAFSRKQLLQPEPLDLSDVVRELAPSLRRLIREDIAFVTDGCRPGAQVYVDRTQAEQALMNLCANARDAMPNGGRLEVSTDVVDVGAEQAAGRGEPGRYAVLTVTDDGVGMDEETSSRIFEPFYTTKEVGNGTGLGLSMVYGFAQQSGGWVELKSSPGSGAVFRVLLPHGAAIEQHAPISPRPGGPTDGHETVLVVEDDQFVRELEVETLRRHGYRVLAPRDPEEALTIGRGHPGPIHLLVSDVVMPGMSGPELCRHLQQARPDIRVLFVSGYSENSLVDRGVVRRGTHLLPKPFTPDDLARMARQVLDLQEV